MDATARIKNLSIALEALSRVNHPAAEDAFDRVWALLKSDLIEEARKEKGLPSARPARVETDDEIPF